MRQLALFVASTTSIVFGVSEYARKCEAVIGVPVPTIDCSSPAGSEVSVGKIEKGRCENPSHGLSGCNPGTRFIKYTDSFTRNGKIEVVTTFVMCRKTDGDTKRAKRGEGNEIYSDIGVIQYNETKHATCWFSKTEEGQLPTEKIGDRLAYPSPSKEQAPGFWGDKQPDSKCIQCHQSGVWLRSPFAMGVVAKAGAGLKRSGREGEYQLASGNEIPENNEKVARRGIPCFVALPDWSQTDGNGDSAPIRMKISASAYNKKFPPRADQKSIASAGKCTECHYLGVGSEKLGRMTCNDLMNEFEGSSPKLLLPSATFERHKWMPPGADGMESVEAYRANFLRSFEAVKWCCNLGHLKDLDYDVICRGKFPANEEDPLLKVLNSRGACALCPDCQTDALHPKYNQKDH